jgi:predicted DNA-binding ribbon-helix-helix protein
MALKKRSVLLNGHATSISLEEAFWIALKEIAIEHHKSVNALIEWIDENRSFNQENLSSAIRVYVLHHYQNKDLTHA